MWINGKRRLQSISSGADGMSDAICHGGLVSISDILCWPYFQAQKGHSTSTRCRLIHDDIRYLYVCAIMVASFLLSVKCNTLLYPIYTVIEYMYFDVKSGIMNAVLFVLVCHVNNSMAIFKLINVFISVFSFYKQSQSFGEVRASGSCSVINEALPL